ncbi:MAG: hypothetical protein C3F18_12715 [Nitrosomonadales bacterium]|nr:MAG: hypothetical protein C3F18_12715 [Nitrosomonadales bacterium]
MVEEQASAPAREGAGARLRRERESQGLSLFDAARALRLSEKQIAALEADDYSKLPGRTFVRGFIRNYARLVQLDPEPLMAHLSFEKEEESHQIQAPSQKISFSEHQAKPWLKWLLTAFVIMAVVSWAVLEWLGPEQPKGAVSRVPAPVVPPPLPPASAAQPAAAPPAAPVPAVALPPAAPAMAESAAPPGAAVPASALARLTMTFSGRAWVEVRDRNGKIIHSQNNMAGADQVVEGEAPLSLVIGSAPNVKLIYKGQPVDLSAFAKADVARLTLE